EDVGGDGPLLRLAPGGEGLAGLGLAIESDQLDPVRQGPYERHIDLGQPGRVREEERVRLTTLAAARRRPAAGDRLALAGWPEVVGRRALLAVGTGASGEP